jgi:ribosomal protein L6P/L9E
MVIECAEIIASTGTNGRHTEDFRNNAITFTSNDNNDMDTNNTDHERSGAGITGSRESSLSKEH